MNGNPFTANYIGSTGQYPIYDLIKNTSNVLQYNSSNFVKIKVDALSNSVYTEINSIKATDTSQSSQISTLEASAVANTDAILVQAGLIQTIQDLEVIQAGVLVGHTTLLGTLNNSKMDKISFDGASVIYRDYIGNVQLGWDDVTFKDVPIAFATRRLLTLSDKYYNLPTTKQDKITWDSPLSYDTDTNTASVDLNGYLTSNVLSNVNINYGFLHSNALSNLFSPYALSNTVSKYLPLSGGALMGDLTVGTNSSNKEVNIWGNLSVLAHPDSNNEFYVKGNITATNQIKASDFFLGTGDDLYYGNYGARIIATNNSVIGHDLKFQTRTTLSNAFNDSLIINSSGLVGIGGNPSSSKLNVNGVISATDYKIGTDYLSNIYVSSNVFADVLVPYVSSNVLSNVLIPYKPVWKTSGTNIYYNAGNVSIGCTDGLAPLQVQGVIASINADSSDHIRMFNDGSTAYLDAGGADSGMAFRIDTGNSGYSSASYSEKMRILPSGNIGIGKTTPNHTLDVDGTVSANKFLVDTGNYIQSNCVFQISKNFNIRKNYPYDQFNNVGDTMYMQAGRTDNLCSFGMGVDVVIYAQTGSIGLSASNITIDGNVIYGKPVLASNLVNKTPFIINASTSVVINGVSGLYKYDLDVRKYTGTFQTAEGYLMRYFKISTMYSSPAKYYNNEDANSYCFSQNVMMTDSGGLTFFSPYTLGSWYGEFIGNGNYWMRNSFDYITFIHGHISDISNPNKKWYVIIEDLLS